MKITQQRFESLLKSFPLLDPILVLGDCGLDKYTLGKVTRISPEAPVPILEVSKEWEKLGLAANIIDNFCALQVPSRLCTIIGDDGAGKKFQEILQSKGVGQEHVVTATDRPTTYKERITTATQQLCRVDYEKTHPISEADEDKIMATLFSATSSKAMILEDYSKGFFTPRLTAKIIAFAKEHQIMTALDPGRQTQVMSYKGVDLLKPNLSEAKIMAKALGYNLDQDSLPLIGELLIEKLDLKKLVITLGPEGMALFDTENSQHWSYEIPTLAREVYDVSGAGDTTIAVLTASLMANGTLEEAAWMANCAAGIVVGKVGTAVVTREEMLATAPWTLAKRGASTHV